MNNSQNIPSYKIWLLASRPKTLWAGVAPVLIGTAVAYGDSGFNALAAFCALIGAVLIQIGTNLANDYFDFVKGADRSDRKGPLRVTQAGLVTEAAIKRAMIIVFGLAVVSGLYLIYRGGLPILAVGVISIIFGVLYTGGPFPIGYLGLGDLFVFIFFGLVATAGTYYVQTLELTTVAIAAGIAPGLYSSAILAVNNLRDIEEDRKTGKRTLAVRFGRGFARFEYLFCILTGSLSPLLLITMTGNHWFSLIAAFTVITAIPSIRLVFTTDDGAALNGVLAATGKLLLVYTLLFSIGWSI